MAESKRGQERIRNSTRISRRSFLAKAVGIAAIAGGPYIFTRRAGAAGKVFVRSLGGSYEEAERKAIYDPFTKATGIEVVTVPVIVSKLMAMIESGNIEIDVMDSGDYQMLIMRQKGALDRIDYKSFKYTNPEDIDPDVRQEDMVANIYFATVLGYNTQVFPTGKQPRSWAEFWDIKKFPGPRMLSDIGSGNVDLEFALLADGVPIDKIYPIDVDRAFKSLDRIKPAIRKYWDTGAISAQMMADKEVVLGSIWNGRVQALIDKNAPLAIEWNQHMRQMQYWGILKGSPNRENAQHLIDFALQPQRQAELTQHIAYGPTNREAFKYIKPEEAKKLPSNPAYTKNSFRQNAKWWADNRAQISERWSQWLLQKG